MSRETPEGTYGGEYTSNESEQWAGAGQGGGMGYGDLITSIGDMVNSGINTFDDNEKQRQWLAGNDPCYLAEQLRSNETTFLLPTWRRMNSAALRISVSGNQSIDRAIRDWGRPSGDYMNVTPFAMWLVDKGFTPVPAGAVLMGLLGGHWGAMGATAAYVDWIDSKLPATPPPKGSRSGYDGERLYDADRIYLYANGYRQNQPLQHIARGRLRGSGLVEAYSQWAAEVREDAVPPSHNRWRQRLTTLTGQYRDDGRVWKKNDPIDPMSKLGTMAEYKAMMSAERKIAEALCLAHRASEATRNGGGGGGGGNGGAPKKDNTLLWVALAAVLVGRRKR